MVTKGAPYIMREPCKWCMRDDGVPHMEGVLGHSNGQATVRCLRCDRVAYNAPKSETGAPQTKIRSREGLKFGQRERILEACGARCWLCGADPVRDGVQLDIAHAISLAEGRLAGLEDDWLNSDANLFPACLTCNAEMKTRSLDVRMYVRFLLAKLYRNGKPDGGQ